ncbi:alpha/beta hydrolase [Dactylosporangium salmoneum]|uniref:Alpha/beta hydrolase n=1 Tax=Dactylosporangium salmoneum TaxID=53361 RepID=A0ABN3G244_9ACTN
MSRSDVTFDSAGIRLAGHLYLPGTPSDSPRPALVVSHPGSGVKEQAAGLYARLLSERGYVTLAFDAAFQGESGGEPHGQEDPAHRVEDIKAAVSYLTTREEVDPDRIGVLGICASGGYVLTASASDHRIKAIATVSGVDIARQFRFGADGTQDPSVFQAMLDAAATARSALARGEDSQQTFPIFPRTEDEARTMGGAHGADGFSYYCSPRAFHPRSAKFFTWTSVDRMATFDAFYDIPLIGQRPTLFIVGREAVTAWMAVEAFQRITGPKEIIWVEGASHVDLYDKPEYVDPAIEKLTEFYGAHLGAEKAAAV